MPGVRDHEPTVIEQFGGLWKRGDPESCPLDHFTQADNVQYLNSAVETRAPIDKFLDVGANKSQVLRTYNYVMQTGQSLLELTAGGFIYHSIGHGVTYGPILSIPDMEDFGFVSINGRAYITPFKSLVNAQGLNFELGLLNEFLYVYKGDGTPARKAGGAAPTGGALVVAAGSAGTTDTGFHILSVVYETDTGYLTSLGPIGSLDFPGNTQIDVTNIPVSPDVFVTKRHLVSTIAIKDYNGNSLGYQFFFIPNGNIDDNTTTSKTIQFYDADLFDDASHLQDNFAEIPAGVSLCTYHSRLVLVGEGGTAETLAGLPSDITDNRSLARVSAPGEPEAISRVDGLIIAPLDGNPLTNCQEFRDILYLFKATRTYAYSDNSDEPATWQEEVVDQGIGAPPHGIAAVLDSGGVNIDFLLVADWSGLMQFNGVYARPELSWKIEDLWLGLSRTDFRYIQVVNDSLSKKIWITLPPPRNIMLYADYGEGMDAKNIKWARWIFDVNVSSICLYQTNMLIVGVISNAI